MSILQRIKANGGDFRRVGYTFSLSPGKLKPDAIAWIKANIDDLKREVWPLFDDWEERAAIMEYGNGLSRADAEREAYACVMGVQSAD